MTPAFRDGESDVLKDFRQTFLAGNSLDGSGGESLLVSANGMSIGKSLLEYGLREKECHLQNNRKVNFTGKGILIQLFD